MEDLEDLLSVLPSGMFPDTASLKKTIDEEGFDAIYDILPKGMFSSSTELANTFGVKKKDNSSQFTTPPKERNGGVSAGVTKPEVYTPGVSQVPAPKYSPSFLPEKEYDVTKPDDNGLGLSSDFVDKVKKGSDKPIITSNDVRDIQKVTNPEQAAADQFLQESKDAKVTPAQQNAINSNLDANNLDDLETKEFNKLLEKERARDKSFFEEGIVSKFGGVSQQRIDELKTEAKENVSGQKYSEASLKEDIEKSKEVGLSLKEYRDIKYSYLTQNYLNDEEKKEWGLIRDLNYWTKELGSTSVDGVPNPEVSKMQKQAESNLSTYREGQLRVSAYKIKELEDKKATATGQDIKEINEQIIKEKAKTKAFLNPVSAAKQIFTENTQMQQSDGRTPLEKMENYYNGLLKRRGELSITMGEGFASLVPLLSDYTGADEKVRKISKLDKEIEALTPIILLNKKALSEDNWMTQLGKSFVGSLAASSPFVTEQEEANFVFDALAKSETYNDVEAANIKALNESFRMTKGELVGSTTGTTLGIMPAMAGGGLAIGGLKNVTKIGTAINKLSDANKAAKIFFGSVETGLAYQASEFFGSSSSVEDESSFLAGFIGEAGVGVLSLIPKNAYMSMMVRAFGKGAPKAHKVMAAIVQRSGTGFGEVIEEYGNEIGAIIDESDGSLRGIRDLWVERFGTLDQNLEFGLLTFGMGVAFGSATKAGKDFSNKHKEWLRQQPEDIQARFEALTKEVNDGVTEAVTSVNNETTSETNKGKAVSTAQDIAEEVAGEGDDDKAAKVITTKGEVVPVGEIKEGESYSFKTDKLPPVLKDVLPGELNEKQGYVTYTGKQLIDAGYAEAATPLKSDGPKDDVEKRRVVAESKIKNKELFSDGGIFSNELGGSGVNSVPTNHTEKNGIEFIEFSNPNTGDVDVVMSGTSDTDFVGFYRIYENGKPTNKWSSKFENQSRSKENFKTMISGVQSMLPKGHEYTEKTSISTDGLRVWNQQLSKGYELQYDSDGKLITSEVAINGDAIVNELGVEVNKGDFENISVTNNKQFESVKKALLPYMQKFGLNESNIRNVIRNANGTVVIDLPTLKSKDSTKEQKPNAIELNKQHKQLMADLISRQKELLNEGIRDFSTDKKWSDINGKLKQIEESVSKAKPKAQPSKEVIVNKKSAVDALEAKRNKAGEANGAFIDAALQQLGMSSAERGLVSLKTFKNSAIYKKNEQKIKDLLQGWGISSLDEVSDIQIIPKFFNGKASLQVSVTHNGKRIGLTDLDIEANDKIIDLGLKTEQADKEYKEAFDKSTKTKTEAKKESKPKADKVKARAKAVKAGILVDERKLKIQIDRARKFLKSSLPGVEIVVHDTVDSFKNATGSVSGGEYISDGKTKTIHINANSANSRTVAHEVFHAVLLNTTADSNVGKRAKKMLDVVIKSKSLPVEDKLKLIEFAKNYEANLQNEEMVAEFLGMLADNFKNLKLEEKRTIKDFIASILSKVGIKIETDADIAKFLNDVAYGIRKGTEVKLDTKKSVEARRKQIIGENAQLSTNVRNNLGLAKKMEKKYSKKEIRLSTGWERGADGKWRYEVGDKDINLSKFKPLEKYSENLSFKGVEPKNRAIKAILNTSYGYFPQMFAPKKRDISKWKESIESTNSLYGIELTDKEVSGALIFLDNLIPSEEIPLEKKINLEKGTLVLNEKLSDIIDKELLELYPSLKEVSIELKVQTNVSSNKEYAIGVFAEYNHTTKKIKATTPVFAGTDPRASLDYFSEELKSSIRHEIQHAIQMEEGFAVGASSSNPDYNRIAGEVEARNVQKRMNYTPEQRRNTLLEETENVAREDQIVLGVTRRQQDSLLEDVMSQGLKENWTYSEIEALLEDSYSKDEIKAEYDKRMAQDESDRKFEVNAAKKIYNDIINSSKDKAAKAAKSDRRKILADGRTRAKKAAISSLKSSNWFLKSVNKPEAEKTLREVMKYMGMKVLSASRTRNVAGSKKDKITINTLDALSSQIKAINKHERIMSKARGDMAKAITELAKKYKGKMSAAKVRAIINKLNTINLSKQAKVDNFIAYVVKMFSDADYSKKVLDANKLRARVKGVAKSKSKNSDLTTVAKKFAKINPNAVEDVDIYIAQANKLIKASSAPRVTTKEVLDTLTNQKTKKSSVKMAETTNIYEIDAYANEQIRIQQEQSLELIRAEYEAVTGEDGTNLTMEGMINKLTPIEEQDPERAEQIRESISEHFDSYTSQIQGLIRSGNISISDKNKSILTSLINIEIDSLSIRQAMKVLEVMNNFIGFESLIGAEAIVRNLQGGVSAKKALDRGYISREIKKWKWPWLGRLSVQQIASIHLMFDRLFANRSVSDIMMKATGMSDIIHFTGMAKRQSIMVLDSYSKLFFNKKPHGEAFNNVRNNVERALIARMIRQDSDTSVAAENFKKNKDLIKSDLDNRKARTERSVKEEKQLEALERFYDDVISGSTNVSDFLDSIRDNDGYSQNLDAVEYWIEQWADIFPNLSEVSSNIYNQTLNKDLMYTPYVYLKKESPTNRVDINEEINKSAFIDVIGNLYDKESNVLKKKLNPSKVPKNRTIGLDFDSNNFYAYKAAMIDVNTASTIKFMDGFISSEEFNSIIPKDADRKLFVKRLVGYVKRIRGKDYINDDSMADIAKVLDQFAAWTNAVVLGAPTALIKQSTPILNTLINTMGSTGMADLMNGGGDFIDLYGYTIAERGMGSTATFENANETLRKAADTWVGKTINAAMKYNSKAIDWYLLSMDRFAARSSWLAYYKKDKISQAKKFKKNAKTTAEIAQAEILLNAAENIDWRTEKPNEKAAQYAEAMVSRNQNVSDPDLQGDLWTNKQAAVRIGRKFLLTYANFVMNKKMQLSADYVMLYAKESSIEDRLVAALSIMASYAEIVAFASIQYAISWAVKRSIDWFTGDDEDEEETRKNKGYAKGNVIKDIASPSPIFDGATIEAFNMAANVFRDEEEIAKESFIPGGIAKGKDAFEGLGMLGVGSKKAYTLLDNIYKSTVSKSVTTTNSDGGKSTKELTDEGVEYLKYAALIQLTSMTLLGPVLGADGERFARELAKRAKKMTVEPKKWKAPTKVK